MTQAEIEAKLGEIRKLKDGWDSYGGKAPTAMAVNVALMVTTPPVHIVPISDGGIVLEWETGEGLSALGTFGNLAHLEMRIGPDGTTAKLYFEDMRIEE